MSETPRGKKNQDPPSYLVSGDRRSLELIFVRIDYATNALIMGDFDTAMFNIEAAWERLPNRIKEKFEEPTLRLKEMIAKIPSEDELWNNSQFMQVNSGWKDIQIYRADMEKRLVQQIVHDCSNRFIQAIDEAGLYMREAGAGISIFGERDDFSKKMAYTGPPEEVQRDNGT